MDIIEKYLRDLKLANRSENTLSTREYFLKKLDKIKPLQEWTREDIDKYLFEVLENKKQSTVEAAKTAFRSFYNQIGQPEKVAHIKIRQVEGCLNRDELLTVEDVDKLISATESPLYKALLAFLFESGARINEVLACRVYDVSDNDGRMFVTVHQTKWGKDKRRVVCLSSAQYIRNLITYLNLSKNDYLFKSSHRENHIDYTMVERTFRNLAKKAGITKPVNPHAFRHSCATNLVLQGYQDALIKKGLGWRQSSKAINRYQHIVDDDFINARLQKEGKIESQTVEPQSLKLAEPIQKVDDKTLLRRLAVENEELKKKAEETDTLKERLQKLEQSSTLLDEAAIQKMIEARLAELMKKG